MSKEKIEQKSVQVLISPIFGDVLVSLRGVTRLEALGLLTRAINNLNETVNYDGLQDDQPENVTCQTKSS